MKNNKKEEEQLKEKIANETQDNISNETVESTPDTVVAKPNPRIDLDIQNQPIKSSKKEKKRNLKTIKKEDPFKMEELHVRGKFKRKKKRQIRRSVNPASLDQSHSFEKPTTPVVKDIMVPSINFTTRNCSKSCYKS